MSKVTSGDRAGHATLTGRAPPAAPGAAGPQQRRRAEANLRFGTSNPTLLGRIIIELG